MSNTNIIFGNNYNTDIYSQFELANAYTVTFIINVELKYINFSYGYNHDDHKFEFIVIDKKGKICKYN